MITGVGVDNGRPRPRHPASSAGSAERRLRVLVDATVAAGMAAFNAWRRYPYPEAIDTEVERQIRSDVRHAYPDAPVLGEECGLDPLDSIPAWFVDPIDGTDSFVQGGGLWAVSVASWSGSSWPDYGAVFAPQRGALYQASPRTGLVVPEASSTPRLPTRRIIFGWAGRHSDELRDRIRTTAEASDTEVLFDVPAALGLAWLAVGSCDSYIEDGVAVWDVAGGLALLQASTSQFTVDACPSYQGERGWIVSTRTGLRDVGLEYAGAVGWPPPAQQWP